MRYIFSILLIIISHQPVFSQTSERIKIAQNPLEKNVKANYLANTFANYIEMKVREKENLVYQFDHRDDKYYFTKFDENCNLLNEGNIEFIDINQKETDTRIREFINIENGFIIYFESHDKKDTCRAYIQKFDLDLKAFGTKIFIEKRRERYNFMTAGNSWTHFNWNAEISKDDTKIMIYKPLLSYTIFGKNEIMTANFYIVDLKTEKVDKLIFNDFVIKGFSTVINSTILNNGTIGIVIAQGNDVKNNRSLVYRFRMLGKNVDTNFVELPFQEIGLLHPGFLVEGDVLSIYSSYYIKKPDQDPSTEGDFAGICMTKINLINRKILLHKEYPAFDVLSSFYDVKKKKLNLESNSIRIKKIVIRDDTTTDFFVLPFKNNTQYQTIEDLIYIKINSKNDITINKRIDAKSKFDDTKSITSNYNMIFHFKNKNTYIVTFEDMKNRVPQKKFNQLTDLEDAVLTTISIDKNGYIKKTYEESIIVRKKFKMNFGKNYILNETSDNLFFYATSNSTYKFKKLLMSYKIPVD